MIGKLIDDFLCLINILFDHFQTFRILIENLKISSNSTFSMKII